MRVCVSWVRYESVCEYCRVKMDRPLKETIFWDINRRDFCDTPAPSPGGGGDDKEDEVISE